MLTCGVLAKVSDLAMEIEREARNRIQQQFKKADHFIQRGRGKMLLSLRRKGLFRYVAVLMVLALFLGGCSTSPSSGNTSSTEQETAGSAGQEGQGNTSGKEVKLEVWVQAKPTDHYRLDNIKVAAEKLNEELKKEGKDIRVVIDGKIEDVDWGNYKQKFVLAFESNKAPDIILSGHEDVAPWSAAGYIVPLDKYIDRYPQFKDVYPTLWEAMSYKGKKWAVPQDTEARPIYYRKDYLSRIGWSQDEIDNLPEKIKEGRFTLDDLLQTAKQAQDKGIVKEGYGFYHRPRQGADFYMFYYAFGGEMQDSATGKLILDKEALLKEYRFFHDTVYKYKTTLPNLIGTEWNIWHKTVTSGQAFINQAGTWTVAEWMAQHNLSEEDWNKMGYALVPAGERGGKPVTLSHPLAYMITSQCENEELAARVLALATDPELNAKHAVESNHLGILKSVENVPLYAENQFLKDVTYMLNYTRYLPNHEKFGTYDEAVFRGLSAVESGQLSPEKAVETVVAELQRQLGDEVVIR